MSMILVGSYNRFIPVIEQGRVNMKKTCALAVYATQGLNVCATLDMRVEQAGRAGHPIYISLPMPAQSTFEPIGTWTVYDASMNVWYSGQLSLVGSTWAELRPPFPNALSNGDTIRVVLSYQRPTSILAGDNVNKYPAS